MVILFYLLPAVVGAQVYTNYRVKKIFIKTDTITIDTLSLINGSLLLTDSLGNKIDSSYYTVKYTDAVLLLKPSFNKNIKTLFVSYKVFPYNFSASYKHKDIKLIEPDEKGNYNPFTFIYDRSSLEFFKMGGLNKNGSISRGISFGNNQDIVVNSSFDLQLSGKLSDEVDVLAAITDNNIPVQPDGNTQQIQDFDKVFIQLSAKNSKLIAGDFELSRPESYFMNFYKKAQGGNFSTSFYTDEKKKNGKISISAAAAISKGKYAKNTIVGMEGSQGPYKLTGAENETYIIVLSGSEKVYINGELMNRGQENDYVIDYNTAEITFTVKRLITKDSRITVEFEYSDKNYARSLFFEGTKYKSKKLNVNFNFFSEQDIKNQPIQQKLTDKEKLLLTNIGDSLNLALTPYVDSVAFSNDMVLYKMVDTLVNMINYDSVFVYSTNADSAHYRLGFSNVGQGNGNYIQIQSSANGRVFKWVAPQAGVRQGNYEPVNMLVTPKKKQMATLSAEYIISKRTTAAVEFAVSNNDLNLFSDKDSKDDVGYALKAYVKNTIPLSKKDSTGWTFSTELSHELTEKNFNPIERYHIVEFERDWNISQIKNKVDQNISEIKFSLKDKKKNFANYKLNSFFAGSQYSGLQNLVNANLEKKGFLLTFTGSLLNSQDLINSSRYIRSKADLSKRTKRFVVGITEEQENNLFNKLSTDSLQKNSFSFNELGVYVSNPDTSKNKYTAFYKKRIDFIPVKNSLKLATTAQSVGVNYEMTKNTNNRLTINNTYRKLTINDSALSKQKEDNSLLSRLEYYLKFLKGVVTSTTYYEIGSGMEVKKEFSFIEVTQGQGIYTWTDYNSNGVKELNEFEIAVFQDQANYIRIFTPTNQYIKTYTNQFNEVLSISPANAWSSGKGAKKFLSRFSNMTTYRIDHKNTDNDEFRAYNPFRSSISDSALISVNSAFRNDLYFNKSSSKFGIDIKYQDSRNKILLVNGFDLRTSVIKGVNIKCGISRKLTLTLNQNLGEKTSSSEYFSTKNYKIDYYESEPVFSYQPGVSFRLNLNYKYSEKKNKIGSLNERAFINKAGFETKYNVLSKGSLIFKFEYIKIAYNSPENSTIAYEMLEGLKKGDNSTWNLSYQRNISTNLQLDLSYNGRKSIGSKIIHVGSVQLRAYF
ncbi:MAG: hypothetical protein HGB12_10025 [Bacteroidetes bacterium]|nr:hypothetical protein [Bacteroidota bacterium]